MIQLVHRVLSLGLAIAAVTALLVAWRTKQGMGNAVARFLLITGQVATGIATLHFSVPTILSIVHQVGAMFLLAASFVFLRGRAAEVRRSAMTPALS